MFEKEIEALKNAAKEVIAFVPDQIAAFFNTEFWSLVGYTGIGALSAVALAYFFPALRGFAGAIFFGLIAVWIGFHKGQASKQAEIDKLKVKPKPVVKIVTPVDKKPWQWQ